jgi:dolichol-phosphate mannosyltransferase
LVVRVIIPVLNEAESLPLVLRELREHMPRALVTVVDGHSTDATREVARELGVPMIVQEGDGKGSAVAQALKLLDVQNDDILVMMDGDYTYSAKDARRLVQRLEADGYDLVAGSRLHGRREEGSLSKFNLIGNRILTRFAEMLHNYTAKDVCTGLWVFRGSAMEELSLNEGFELEAGLFASAANSSLSMSWVPIDYRRRRYGQPKLESIRDGFKIIQLLCREAKNRRS